MSQPGKEGNLVEFAKVYRLGILVLIVSAGCTSLQSTFQNDRISQLNQEGVQQLAKNDVQQAHATFIEAWKLQPTHADTLYNLAQNYQRQGQLGVAEQYYRQALQHKPDHGPSRHNLYLLMRSQDRSKTASEEARQWALAQPRSADAQAMLGWMCHLDGDLPTAQAHLQRALSLDPHHSQAQLELGKVYQDYQLPDRARGLYQRIPPDDAHYAEAQGLLMRLGESVKQGRGQGKPLGGTMSPATSKPATSNESSPWRPVGNSG